ncbi:MAG: phage terminase large subunit, partial [Acidobacteria bacterium]|nr:phage terminase large subunit [Acidobacteriota bacterium]
LIIIDDPVKSRAFANSANFRDNLWDWYKDDMHTRLEPGAAVVLIQTRWHDDDLAGRLLKDMEDGGETWEVVRLPALAEGDGVRLETGDERLEKAPVSSLSSPVSADPLDRLEGQALWPERFTSEDLLATKRRLGAGSFAALYQQRPLPEGGTLFKAEWFRNIVSKHPAGLRWARGYDLAVSLKDSADYTASFRCAIDERTGTLYIADGFRKRIEYPEQKRFIIDKITVEPDTRHGIELALHGRALVQELRREAQIIGRVLVGVKVDGDKLMRAEAWSSYAEEGSIALVNGPWINDFVDEACRFTGKGDAHDDQIDAVSIAIQMLRKSKGGMSF